MAKLSDRDKARKAMEKYAAGRGYQILKETRLDKGYPLAGSFIFDGHEFKVDDYGKLVPDSAKQVLN